LNGKTQHMPKIRIITIAQQYGSNGDQIAASLASRLQWPLFDREVVRQVAQQLNITEDEAAIHDEHTFSFFERVLLTMQFCTSEAVEAWANQFAMPISPARQENLYYQALQQVIDAIVCEGNSIIVGHGAQGLLANRSDTMHVQITAPFAQRVDEITRLNQLHKAEAYACLQQKDQGVARYFQVRYQRDINDPALYDLVLNSATSSLEDQVDLIMLSLERKNSALAAPESYDQPQKQLMETPS